MSVRVLGIEETMRNLNTKVGEIKNGTMAGLLAGGLIIQRQSQQWTPVEYGNLRGSAYTRRNINGSMSVEIGYTAAYALFVHENMEQTLKGEPRQSGLGEYWGPEGRPQFLRDAAETKSNDVVDVVRRYAGR